MILYTQDFTSHPGLRRDSSKIDSAEVDSLKLHPDRNSSEKNAEEVNGRCRLCRSEVKSPPSKDNRKNRN